MEEMMKEREGNEEMIERIGGEEGGGGEGGGG